MIFELSYTLDVIPYAEGMFFLTYRTKILLLILMEGKKQYSVSSVSHVGK